MTLYGLLCWYIFYACHGFRFILLLHSNEILYENKPAKNGILYVKYTSKKKNGILCVKYTSKKRIVYLKYTSKTDSFIPDYFAVTL
jgi:hypothetical protein